MALPFVTILPMAFFGCTVESRPVEDGRTVDGEVAPPPDLDLIEPMLAESAESWNSGDLDGFLDDYATDPALTFVGSSGVTRGRAAVRESYLEGYWASGEPADSLRFAEIEVRPLGDRHALAIGRWILRRPAGESEAPESGETITAEGRFSLVLRWQAGEWKIVHDHSS